MKKFLFAHTKRKTEIGAADQRQSCFRHKIYCNPSYIPSLKLSSMIEKSGSCRAWTEIPETDVLMYITREYFSSYTVV